MTQQEEKRFKELVERGHVPVDVMDGLRELIEDVASRAHSDGCFAESFAIHTA